MTTNIIFRSFLFALFLLYARTDNGGSPQSENKTDSDADRVNYILLQSGGPPGKVPAEVLPAENPEPTDPYFWGNVPNDPCTEWAYEYTNISHNGVARHEHAVLRYQGTKNEVLDIAGFLIVPDRINKRIYVVDYWKQGDNTTTHSVDHQCHLENWKVVKCSPRFDKNYDYIVHQNQDFSCRSVGTPSLTPLGNSTLEDVVDVRGLHQYTTLNYFNSSKLLEHFGGPPGTFPPSKTNPRPPPEPEDPTQRPLPDPPRESWIYNHWLLFLPSAIRIEYATVRFAGTPKQFLDVHGILYWRSNVGDFRVAYRQDDTGFYRVVQEAECILTRGLWKCVYPKYFKQAVGAYAGGAVSGQLLATLVGGG